MVKKILFADGRKFFWSGGDFHSNYGFIREKDIKNGSVKSNKETEFLIADGKFIDNVNKIKRGPAVTHLKDIGSIIVYTGIDKKSVCVDAGSGCGLLSAFLGKICKKVYSYEKRRDFYDIAKRNLDFLDVKNVILKNEDIINLKEKNIDLITLDLSNPWEYLDVCYNSLKSGGFLVCYLPNITQVSEVVSNIKKNYVVERVSEVLERNWIFDDKKMRPENQMLGHTAFLVFLRKI